MYGKSTVGKFGSDILLFPAVISTLLSETEKVTDSLLDKALNISRSFLAGRENSQSSSESQSTDEDT